MRTLIVVAVTGAAGLASILSGCGDTPEPVQTVALTLAAPAPTGTPWNEVARRALVGRCDRDGARGWCRQAVACLEDAVAYRDWKRGTPAAQSAWRRCLNATPPPAR